MFIFSQIVVYPFRTVFWVARFLFNKANTRSLHNLFVRSVVILRSQLYFVFFSVASSDGAYRASSTLASLVLLQSVTMRNCAFHQFVWASRPQYGHKLPRASQLVVARSASPVKCNLCIANSDAHHDAQRGAMSDFLLAIS